MNKTGVISKAVSFCQKDGCHQHPNLVREHSQARWPLSFASDGGSDGQSTHSLATILQSDGIG